MSLRLPILFLPYIDKKTLGSLLFRSLSAVLIVIAIFNSRPAWSDSTSEDLLDYQVRWSEKVPMRDGTKLNATIYMPITEGGSPAIVTITPYISDRFHADAVYFARRGYVYVIVDTRGRGNSEGTYEPFVQKEGDDGSDVIAWAAKQQWTNGKIAMRGASYSGHNQWLTAAAFPKNLTTIVPVASPYVGFDFPMQNNRPIVFGLSWRMLTDGFTSNGNIASDFEHWDNLVNRLYISGKPYASLDTEAGMPSKLFQDWMKHPSWDAYWEARNPTDDKLARVSLPVLTITGYYDGDQKGALELYRRHMRNAPKEAQKRHYLIIGPWSHGGTRTPTTELGGYTFGDKSVIDMKELDVAWYDWTMKSGTKPEFLQDRVAYFLAGANRWVYTDSLDSIAKSEKKLYLSSHDGNAGDVFSGGKLDSRESLRQSKPDQYSYDPAELPPVNSATTYWNQKRLVDQSQVYNIQGKGVIYTSAPFSDATEITGNVRFDAWIEMDVPDADFEVYLYEIFSDGSSVLLTYDTLRARYRNSSAKGELVKPGEIVHYVFNTFDFFSRLVAKGSRLRLVLRAPSSLAVQVNFNSGGVVAEETIHDARKATIKIHHDQQHPSALTIPIVTDSEKK